MLHPGVSATMLLANAIVKRSPTKGRDGHADGDRRECAESAVRGPHGLEWEETVPSLCSGICFDHGSTTDAIERY